MKQINLCCGYNVQKNERGVCMKESLIKNCDLFLTNRNILKNKFKWSQSELYPLCASIYTSKNLEIDGEKIKQSRELIKNQTGIFSNFRGTSLLVLATMLSLEQELKVKLTKTLYIYKLLKKEFFTSEYLPLVALVIVNMSDEDNYKDIITKAKELYKCMKKEHPFLTSTDDHIYAVMFAMKDLSVEQSITQMETCYDLLRKNFMPSNALQALSHVLALGEENAKQKCEKAVDIYNKLKKRGLKYGKGMQLPTLGVLALLEKDTNSIVNEICDLYEYLKSIKGFWTFSMSKAEKIMYTAIIMSNQYTDESLKESVKSATVSASVLSIIAAQQAAMIAVVASSATTTSGADS